MKDLISVIISTKNEEWCIERCLQSISEQTYKKTEIILVDNFSTDNTRQLAKKYTNKVFLHGNERSAQRNYGFKIAKGDYGIYVDADMILHPRLLEDSLEELKKKKLSGLYIKEIILGKSYWCKVKNFDRSFCDATTIDAVRFINIKKFKEIGGFDTDLIGFEDWDFNKRLKSHGKVALLSKILKKNNLDWKLKEYVEKKNVKFNEIKKACIFHDETNFKISKFIIKKKYYIKSLSNYKKKWGHKDKELKKQFGFLYRFLFIYIEKKKWKRFLLRPDLIMGIYILNLIKGYIKFTK